MSDYKFKIGQSVFVRHVPNAPSGAYIVTKRMPERGGQFQYQVKNVNESHERVVDESQLSSI
jgi:hypothetical protein